jgi:nitrate reductase delta subunit
MGKEAKESLGDSIDIIALIGGHLKKNKSPYKVIFAALEALSKIKVNKFRVGIFLGNKFSSFKTSIKSLVFV